MATIFVLPTGGRDAGELLEPVREACRRAVGRYCERYGDATEKPDPDEPDQPMVRRHFDMVESGGGLAVAFYGRSGHMGKIRELDCAATKAAEALCELSDRLEGAELYLADAPPAEQQNPPSDESVPELDGPQATSAQRVVMQGGQGFVPTHSIRDVQRRVARAARRAVKHHLQQRGLEPDAARVDVTFERLHNNAFERPVDCPGMEAALAAAHAAEIDPGEPVRGWDVSCDARLFADLCPDTDVVTFGAGKLRYAHSENESVALEEILAGAEALTYLALLFGRD
jgi:acetylornithine deacetylase/succinyl-diaminopimelate desuccinylase-like protein